MAEEYRSGERKALDYVGRKTKPAWDNVRDFSDFFVGSMYGAVVSPLRVSTVVRRFQEEQILGGRVPLPPSSSEGGERGSAKFLGFMVGGITGGVADLYLLEQLFETIRDGNYLPVAIAAGVVAAGNIWSGVSEVRRRREGLALAVVNDNEGTEAA